MSSKIAEGMASTGPDDSLVAVDASGTTPSEVVSKIKTVSTSVATDSLTVASNSATDPATLANALKVTDGKIGLDSKSAKTAILDSLVGANDATRRINQANGVNLSGISGMDASTMALAESYLPGIANANTLNLANDAGKIFTIGKDTDTNTAAGLMKGIGALTGVGELKSVIDQNAWAATGLAYLNKAAALGIPDAIDVLMAKFKDDALARQTLIDSLRSVVISGDIVTLKKIIGYIGNQAAVEKLPDICSLLLSSYVFARDTAEKEYPARRTELLAVLTGLDPTWDTVTRNGEPIGDLSMFTYLSPDAYTLLWLSPGYEVKIMIAPKFPAVSLVGLLKTQYPLMVDIVE